EEPGRERRRPPAEALDRLQHLQERLRRQVLGVVAVADAHVQIAVDPVEVDQVQLFERIAVARLGTLDQPADPFGGLTRGLLRSRGLLGHHKANALRQDAAYASVTSPSSRTT